jgi:hypothetical protein
LLQRLRLLSGLLKATEENLNTLRRAEAVEANERFPIGTPSRGSFAHYTPPSGLIATLDLAGGASALDRLAWDWPREKSSRPS